MILVLVNTPYSSPYLLYKDPLLGEIFRDLSGDPVTKLYVVGKKERYVTSYNNPAEWVDDGLQ